MEEQLRLKTVLMRGGSSKAIFLNEGHIPSDRDERTGLLLALFGSPDKRQIDGLGGADYLTTKGAIMGPPSRPDADIDYTFVQVSIEHPVVSYDLNCGNVSAAAGLYAVEEGYVRLSEPETIVRVHNTNTGKILRIKVPVVNGQPTVEGDYAIDGVPGTGAAIGIDFSSTAGAATGRLLPTGNVVDRIELKSLGRTIGVSIVDIANLCVFIPAQELGLTGAEGPNALSAEQLTILEEIRVACAALAGVESYLLPFQVIVGQPQTYPSYGLGLPVPEASMDLTARFFAEGTMHKAFAGTGGTCLAVAALIDGTVVNSVRRSSGDRATVRIGHPSGTLAILADVRRENGGWDVREVLFSRTARRLMEGYSFLRRSRLAKTSAFPADSRS